MPLMRSISRCWTAGPRLEAWTEGPAGLGPSHWVCRLWPRQDQDAGLLWVGLTRAVKSLSKGRLSLAALKGEIPDGATFPEGVTRVPAWPWENTVSLGAGASGDLEAVP